MTDQYNRNIDYLRISITDRCNLRCRYCMSDITGQTSTCDILTLDEILIIVRNAADLGVSKVKITGGEPLLREDLLKLLKEVKSINGINEVSITTNGILLEEKIEGLLEANVDGINISLDTLNKEKYEKITGADNLDKVMRGLWKALDCGIKTKINVVSLDYLEESLDCVERGKLTSDWIDLIELTKNNALDVRFIEMMPIGKGKGFSHVPHDLLIQSFFNTYKDACIDNSSHGNGPAKYYNIPGYIGGIGFISAINERFCQNCNRIRLTSQGILKSCLCYSDGVMLKPILRGNSAKEGIDREIKECIKKVIYNKPYMHCFDMPELITEHNDMNLIGG